MSGEKNKMNDEGKKNQDRLAEDDNYDFIKETIKSRPLNKRLLLLRGLGIAAAGLLFGTAAAGAFALAGPAANRLFGREEEARVEIPRDDPAEAPAVETPVPETPTPSPVPEPEIVEVERELGLRDYEKLYQDVLSIAEEPRKALVTVSGVTGEEALLDNTFLRGGRSAGIIIVENEADYYVLTDTRATDGAEKIQVTLADGSIAEGRLQKSDGRTGLAVVLVAKEQLSPETLEELSVAALGNSYSLIQGKPVIAVGSPSGYQDSVSYGIITSVMNKVAVTDAEYNLLTTDILGSSKGSGVLLDLEGEVIGVIAQSFGPQEDGAQHMVKGLAVSQLKPLIEMLSNGEEIRYLGVKGQDVTEAIWKSTGIPVGVYVDRVEEDSPAMLAGIQSGDVIVALDGQEVATVQRYSTLLQGFENGQKVKVSVMRSLAAEGYTRMEMEAVVQVR